MWRKNFIFLSSGKFFLLLFFSPSNKSIFFSSSEFFLLFISIDKFRKLSWSCPIGGLGEQKFFFADAKLNLGRSRSFFQQINIFFCLEYKSIAKNNFFFWDCKKCFNYYYYLFYFLARGIEHFVNFKSFVFCQFLCILYIHFLCY